MIPTATGIISLGTSVPDHSASLNQRETEIPCGWKKQGWRGRMLSGIQQPQETELCVKREPDGRWWHRLRCLWKQHCQHLAKAKGRKGALCCLHGAAATRAQEETVQHLNRSLHKTAQPQECCKGTERAELYTHTSCRKETR